MKKAAVALLCLMMFFIFSAPVFAGGIEVSSQSGDRVSLFNDINVDSNVNGNVICVLGNVSVNSQVSGQVISVFGNVTVDSQVGGQVVTVFGNTKLTGKALVNGDVITLGSLDKESGAKILGQEVRIFGEYMNVDIQALLYLRLALLLLFALAVLVIGLLVLTVSRKRYEEMAKLIEYNSGKKLILGFLAYAGATILAVLLLITLIAPVLYLVLLIIATIPACIYFGRLILRALNPKNSIYMEFVTGLITITLVKLLLLYLLPQDGILISLILLGVFGIFVNSVGLGVMMEARFVKKPADAVKNQS